MVDRHARQSIKRGAIFERVWNYRVIEHKNGDMEIVEQHYNEAGDPYGWAEASAFAAADDVPTPLNSLRQTVIWITAALDKPSLPATGCQRYCCVPSPK